MQTKTIINVKEKEEERVVKIGDKVRAFHLVCGEFNAIVARIKEEYFLIDMDNARYLKINVGSLCVGGTTHEGAVIKKVYEKCEINLEG
jgi:hypothetical protein